jgi:hypothetical protein
MEQHNKTSQRPVDQKSPAADSSPTHSANLGDLRYQDPRVVALDTIMREAPQHSASQESFDRRFVREYAIGPTTLSLTEVKG